ncbi:SoxR reducing system RseC family protein [Chromatiaceae bacterium AAb-1]|nr:SoxR reducing system RseC family protein [Chromatiaceae bacterium AAb-1]
MADEIATVVSSEHNGVWLSTTPVSSCHACHASENCGAGVVAKTFTPKKTRFFVVTDKTLLPGERVRIAITEQSLIKAAFMVYLMPLLLMFACILLARHWWQPAEGWLILLAVVSAAGGFLLARKYNHWLARQPEQITITEVLPQLGLQPAALSSSGNAL